MYHTSFDLFLQKCYSALSLHVGPTDSNLPTLDRCKYLETTMIKEVNYKKIYEKKKDLSMKETPKGRITGTSSFYAMGGNGWMRYPALPPPLSTASF
jgi:hypothetical protein